MADKKAPESWSWVGSKSKLTNISDHAPRCRPALRRTYYELPDGGVIASLTLSGSEHLGSWTGRVDHLRRSIWLWTTWSFEYLHALSLAVR